jgi:hypothetical protein
MPLRRRIVQALPTAMAATLVTQLGVFHLDRRQIHEKDLELARQEGIKEGITIGYQKALDEHGIESEDTPDIPNFEIPEEESA